MLPPTQSHIHFTHVLVLVTCVYSPEDPCASCCCDSDTPHSEEAYLGVLVGSIPSTFQLNELLVGMMQAAVNDGRRTARSVIANNLSWCQYPFLLLFAHPSSNETDTMIAATALCKQTG